MKKDAKNEIVARLKTTAVKSAAAPKKPRKKRKITARETDASNHPLATAFNTTVALIEARLGEPTEHEKTPGYNSNQIAYTSATWDIRSNKGEKPIFNITLDHRESHISFTYASDVVKATASGTTAKLAAKAFMDSAAQALDYAESKKRDVAADNENLRSIVGILDKIK